MTKSRRRPDARQLSVLNGYWSCILKKVKAFYTSRRWSGGARWRKSGLTEQFGGSREEALPCEPHNFHRGVPSPSASVLPSPRGARLVCCRPSAPSATFQVTRAKVLSSIPRCANSRWFISRNRGPRSFRPSTEPRHTCSSNRSSFPHLRNSRVTFRKFITLYPWPVEVQLYSSEPKKSVLVWYSFKCFPSVVKVPPL